jgi:hypothetical protein
LKGLKSSSTILYLGSREVPKALRRGANLEGYARPPACAAPDNTPLWSYETGAPVRSVSVSSDGSHVTAGSGEHPRGSPGKNHLKGVRGIFFSIRDGVVSGRQKGLNSRGGPTRGRALLESRRPTSPTADLKRKNQAREQTARYTKILNLICTKKSRYVRKVEFNFDHRTTPVSRQPSRIPTA